MANTKPRQQHQQRQQRRSNNSDVSENNVPMELVFPKSAAKCRLQRGRFLGKGTFACCFEFIDTVSKKPYAVKTISHKILKKHMSSYDRVIQKVTIHGSLNHQNVVRLLEYFENDNNVYMVMELCSERSMMELLQSRHTVTEFEARFFMSHIVSGVAYLHENKIIHRDIKLGNLLICKNMVVKVADFGLAVYESELSKVQYEKCGTPNYISPEMLNIAGYSYPIDIWAIGVVLFTLISGTPPFETDNIDKTYKLIKSGAYKFSLVFGVNARSLIKSLLHLDPSERPLANQICNHAFFTESYCPKQLPRSAMIATPRVKNPISGGTINIDGSITHNAPTMLADNNKERAENEPANYISASDAFNIPSAVSLKKIIEILEPFDNRVGVKESLQRDEEAPSKSPIYWITRWVAIKQFGFAYQLSNGITGFMFCDNTKLIIDAAEKTLQYIDEKGNENFCDVNQYPETIRKKAEILVQTLIYMKENLVVGGEVLKHHQVSGDEEANSLERWPSVLKWYFGQNDNNNNADAFCTSDGSLQVNFKDPHIKVVVSSTLAAVTFILKDEFHTYELDHLFMNGCPPDVLMLLRRVKEITTKVMSVVN